MINYEVVGRRIREERLSKKISQKDFAKKLGVTTGYVCQIENGQKCFNLKRFEQVAEILEKPTSYFVEGTSDDNSESIMHEIISLVKVADSKKLEMIKDVIKSIVDA